jgi:hypothetical protein
LGAGIWELFAHLQEIGANLVARIRAEIDLPVRAAAVSRARRSSAVSEI